MTISDRTQQLALLLNLVGDDAAQTALSSLDKETATELTQCIKEFKNDPPSKSEISYVLNDFERFFSFALDQIQDELDDAVPGKGSSASEPEEIESFEAPIESVKTFAKPTLTGDTKHDLNLLHPYQVAYALRNDSPSAIAIVLKNVTDAYAAKTLEFLPSDIRLQVFLALADPLNVQQKVQMQILEATLQSALKVETRVPEEDRTGQMVAMVRSLPKHLRGELLEKLKESFPELADEVKAQMYQFEDIIRLTDRDIQKILAQSDSDSLVLALVEANNELREKLLGNMSKRARQTIEDELEFKTNAKEDEIAMAKGQIVELLVKLDESGEISLE